MTRYRVTFSGLTMLAVAVSAALDASGQSKQGGRARMLKDFRQPPVWEANYDLYNSLCAYIAAPARLWARFGKRTFDVVGAGVLLLVTAPLLALVAIAVRVTMGRPVMPSTTASTQPVTRVAMTGKLMAAASSSTVAIPSRYVGSTTTFIAA